MITFKQFLSEMIEYNSAYPNLRTSKPALKLFKERLSKKLGIAERNIKIVTFLVDNRPTYRFRFDVTLRKNEDPKLVGHLISSAAKKDLEMDYPKVMIKDAPSPFKGFSKNMRTVFSLYTIGEQD